MVARRLAGRRCSRLVALTGADWWGAEFQIGRAPLGAKYFAVWRALFESFAPVERALAPVYRFVICSRVARFRGEAAPDSSDVRTVAFRTALSTLNVGGVVLGIGKPFACICG